MRWLAALALFTFVWAGWRSATGKLEKEAFQPPEQDWFPKAPPPPPLKGEAIRVTTVDELFDVVERAKPNSTVLVAEGHYFLPRRLNIRVSGLTLRGETGRREQVILDGEKHKLGELFAVTGCSNVTVADLTVQNVAWNGIELDTDTGVHRSPFTTASCITFGSERLKACGCLQTLSAREIVASKCSR